MTLEIFKLDGLARVSVKTSSRGRQWRLPTIVRPILHEAAMDYIGSLPRYQDTFERWMTVSVNDNSPSGHFEDETSAFTPMIIETLLSVQFQEFDPDLVLSRRRENAFLLFPIDRVLFQTDQYIEYLDRLLDSGLRKTSVLDTALSFPFLGKNANLDEIKDRISKINPDIVVLSDIGALLRHPRKLIKYLEQYHGIFDVNHVIWAPRVPTSWIPFLAYLGVDLFDEFPIVQATRLKLVLTRMGAMDRKLLKTLSMLNPQENTSTLKRQPKDRLGKEILDLNKQILYNVLKEATLAISAGRLRDLVRSTANIHPTLKLALRLLTSSELLLELLESNVPLKLSGTIWCTDETDVDRPEVSRYRKWSRARWTPPSNVVCCVVLPCSAKKPYRSSQSHHLFTKVLQFALGKWYYRTQEIIFTSPFGGVPRSLDMTHPISSYDVTVTGEWNSREAEQSAIHLRDMLAKMPSHVPVVVHLSEVETSVVEPYLASLPHEIIYVRSSESPTKEPSLALFEEALNRVKEQIEQNENLASLKFDKKVSLQSDYEILRTVLAYQFGKSQQIESSPQKSNPLVESFLKEPLRIRGKRRIQLKFFRGNKQLGTFHGDSGLVTLTLHGAEILVEHQVNLVKVDTRDLRGGTVYLPAIKDADLSIVPGAPVAVVGANEPSILLASGRALLPGRYLKSLTRGAGVTIKHKKK